MADKRFPEESWKKLVAIIASCFSMDPTRSDRLYNSATAKLIAAIPFLAGCREPERTALAHLSVLVVAGSEAAAKIYDHKAEDNYDVLARLATIAHFEGGDPVVINHGMKHLASMIIEGYKKDAAADKAKGVYNPVAEGKWDADEKLRSIRSSIASVENAEMDAIVAGAAYPWWMM